MGGKMSRDKGARAERAVIGFLQPIVDTVYRKHGLVPPKMLRNSLQSAVGGADTIVQDRGLSWIAVEVKHHETFKFGPWWAQTVKQAGSSKMPVLLYKKNNVQFRCRRFAHEAINGQMCTTVVDTSLDAFLDWFRMMLDWRLQNLLAEAAEKRRQRNIRRRLDAVCDGCPNVAAGCKGDCEAYTAEQDAIDEEIREGKKKALPKMP
ncbi:MAG: hypothetical protein AB7C95_00800 [Synergistaceae bacterium]